VYVRTAALAVAGDAQVDRAVDDAFQLKAPILSGTFACIVGGRLGICVVVKRFLTARLTSMLSMTTKSQGCIKPTDGA
jgi:hypothetical protein